MPPRTNSNARVGVRLPATGGGTTEYLRRAIRFIAGSGISYTMVDDPANEEVELTITSTGGGGGSAPTTQVMSYRLFTSGVGAASTTALTTDYTIAVDPTTTAATVNLPAAATVTGQIFAVKHLNSSANTVTIDASGAETIDGATTLVLTAYTSATVQSTGSAWVVL
jgi:hypothetical protein